MEVGTEISKKIRSAIKAKLMELGAYVDDELPDYIMVMVANKKNKAQMRSDLGLFLSTNTDAFTTWLHGLLAKLQTLSVETKTEKPKGAKSKKKDKQKSGKSDTAHNNDKKKNRKRKSSQGNTDEASEAKVLSLETKECEENADISKDQSDINGQTEQHQPNEAVAEGLEIKESTQPEINQNNAAVQEEVEDVRQLLVTDTPGDELAQELDAAEEEVVTKFEQKKTSDDHPQNVEKIKRKKVSDDKSTSERLKPKRKVPSSVVANVNYNQDEEDEYDPLNPAVGSVASVVKVTSRKSSVPLSMQANRTLLVKAVSDAEKSVAIKRKIAVTRPINRQVSPAEYSPKRKSAARSSPPPYIPSKKSPVRGRGSVFDSSRSKHLSRDDVRHTLGRHEDQGRSHDRRSASSIKGNNSKYTDSRRREARDEDEIKDLQITARVGQMRAFSASPDQSSDSEPTCVTVAVEPVRKAKNVQQSSQGVPSAFIKKALSAVTSGKQDARKDIEAVRKVKDVSVGQRGARVISKMARDAVQKQCKAAVMSVKGRESNIDNPDFRVVRCESLPSDVEVVIASDDDSDNDQSSTESEVPEVVEKSDEPTCVMSTEISSRNKRSDKRTQSVSSGVKKGEEDDVEDLSDMLEDEEADLDQQLLLTDDDKNDFTLDLDDDLSHVVKEVSAEEDGSGDKGSGIRFIVTLDGVDGAQFDDTTTDKSTIPAAQTASTVVPPVLTQLTQPVIPTSPAQPIAPVASLPPFAPMLQPRSLPQSLPTQAPMMATVRPRPPKIQPFSISLRDSDDEHEEKIVTYVQAGDSTAITSTEELTALQRARLQERCRFWPACAAGADCQYHHPTTHCKTFPNCKFADKCLFIHPNCRFDSKCTRADCPYTHTSKRRASQLVLAPPPRPHYPSIPVYPIPTSTTTICHFFPNCLNLNCQFLHPKPCMYGPACANPTCAFYHTALPVQQTSPTIPDKGKLKWQASSVSSQPKKT